MKFLKITFFVAFFAILQSCSSIYVDSLRPNGVDYKGIKTFAWVNPVDADGEHRYDDKMYAPVILKPQLMNSFRKVWLWTPQHLR